MECPRSLCVSLTMGQRLPQPISRRFLWSLLEVGHWIHPIYRRERLRSSFELMLRPTEPGGRMRQRESAFAIGLQRGDVEQEDKDALKALSLIQHHQRPLGVWRPQDQRRQIVAQGALALAMSFMVAAMLIIFMCMRLRSKEVKAGLQERALAAGDEDDDRQLNSILEECLAMAEEFDETKSPAVLPEKRQAEEEQEEEAPQAKIARLQLSLLASAAAFEEGRLPRPSTSHVPVLPGQHPPHPEAPPSAVVPSSTASDVEGKRWPELEPDSWQWHIPHVKGPAAEAELLAHLESGAWLEQISPIVTSDPTGQPGAEVGAARHSGLPSAAGPPSTPPGTASLGLLEDAPSILTVQPGTSSGFLYPHFALAPGAPFLQEPQSGVLSLPQGSGLWPPHLPLAGQRQAGTPIPTGKAGSASTPRALSGAFPSLHAAVKSRKQPSKGGIGARLKGQPHTEDMAPEQATSGGEDFSEGSGIMFWVRWLKSREEKSSDEESSAPLAALPPREPWDPTVHPYLRLPVVNPELIPRDFRPNACADPKYLWGSIAGPLRDMRELFLQPSLTPQQIERLLRSAESIAFIAIRKLMRGFPMTFPGDTLSKMAMMFLVFDALVSARMVLGDRMGLGDWWRDYAGCFPTEQTFDKPALRSYPGTEFRVRFINLASSALSVYKTGVRPQPKVIIKLKRMLFNSPYSPKFYRGPDFDAWRMDDEDFHEAQDDADDSEDGD
ncbi:hypothetical protein Efla_004509 [Eimeria flavescens]